MAPNSKGFTSNLSMGVSLLVVVCTCAVQDLQDFADSIIMMEARGLQPRFSVLGCAQQPQAKRRHLVSCSSCEASYHNNE